MPKRPPQNRVPVARAPQGPNEDLHMKPKQLKRFYEVLVLLRVLGQVQGERVSGDTLDDSNMDRMQMIELRRKVTYHLCVMCDFEKGGNTVTAIAMENLPSGPCYWIGVNGCLNKIKKFLNEVLELLLHQEVAPEPTESTVLEDKLFRRFVLFQRTRIKEYWKLLQRGIKIELNRVQLSLQRHVDSDDYADWLRNFDHPLEDDASLYNLSQLAYDTRHSPFLRVAYDPIIASLTMVENESRADIRHYVGRLSAPMRAATVLAYAGINHPSLFHGFSIKRQGSNATSQRPIPRAGLTLSGIANRMFSANSIELQEISEALQSLDDKGSLTSRVQQHYQSSDWQPRVHAELILLEALYQAKPRFYDDDRYIACSKPACFCCYHYISNHPGSFVHPPCHNKVYLNWQPPELATSSENRHRQQRDIMDRVIDQVRQAITQRVLNAGRTMKWHPDSSTGITPSITMPVEAKLAAARCQTSNNSQVYSSQEVSEIEDDEDGGVPLT